MSVPAFFIRSAGPEDMEGVKTLFKAYAASLEVDLSYQDFAGELAGLPGRYAPPSGAVLLAYDEEMRPRGCVALRAMDTPHCCEMKRLYVLPEARGRGVGKALMDAVVNEAQNLGYLTMRLDSLPSMQEAILLYERMGFQRIPPYYDTPVEGTVFLERALKESVSLAFPAA